MDDELDLRRLAELEEVLGRGLPEIVQTLIAELTGAYGEIDAGLAKSDLEAVAAAAHAARNSALMIDAQPLLADLADLETSARGGSAQDAAMARDRVQRSWPQLRARLERAAAEG